MNEAPSRVQPGPEIEADLADATHREALDARLIAAVETGTRGWAELLAASQGADPRLVAHRVQARRLPIADFAIDDRLPYSRFIGAVSACGRFDANEQWHPLISEFQIGSLKLSKPTN